MITLREHYFNYEKDNPTWIMVRTAASVVPVSAT
jgi:hypothetical protein